MANRMKPDNLSGWATAPAAARLAGDWPAFRCFDTKEEAVRFIAGPARNAERQRRHRQRQRARAVALILTVPDACVSALVSSGRLSPQAALDKGQRRSAALPIFEMLLREDAAVGLDAAYFSTNVATFGCAPGG
jgi:hypothetical protein